MTQAITPEFLIALFVLAVVFLSFVGAAVAAWKELDAPQKRSKSN